MKVFLSWSKDRSKAVAVALREWIPRVLHHAEPWLSSHDGAAVDRQGIELNQELEGFQFGILCVTRESLLDPWIHFEAGALCQKLESAAIWPYLVDADPSEVTGPLATFRLQTADKSSTLELLQTINARCPRSLETARLVHLFEAAWPELEWKLQAITSSASAPRKAPLPSELLEELVTTVRGMDQRLSSLEDTLVPGKKPARSQRATQPPPKSAERKPKVDHKGIMLTIHVDARIGRLQPGQSLRLYCEGDVVESLKQFELDARQYGTRWILRDSSDAYMTREQCANVGAHFNNRVGRLTLDEIVPV